jgi:hypothetical protein
MPLYRCPKGHVSTESNFCSECGARIGSVAEALPPAPAPVPVASQAPVTPGAVACPDCSTPHDPNTGAFCEICGYNFLTGAHAELPRLPTSAPTAGMMSSETTTPPAQHWEVVVTVDPSLRSDDSPEPPTQQAPLTFRLDKANYLIGRHSERRGIILDIALDFDDAISHRHALLTCQVDGSWYVRDIGSANGTKRNGVDLEALVDTPLYTGDELTLGHWTRLTMQVVSADSV